MHIFQGLFLLWFAFFPTLLHASSTANATQTISAGTLAVDIVNSSYVTVASPSIAMSSVNFSVACQSTTGTFGTSSEQIYIENPDAADNGWSVTLAAAAGATAVWDSAGTDLDFNDAGSSGCADASDSDSIAGQLTVDPSGATLSTGRCGSCSTTGVSLGSSTAFLEGTTNSITIATGSAGSNDIGDWTIRGVALTQTIPAEQPVASDYDINLMLTITAS